MLRLFVLFSLICACTLPPRALCASAAAQTLSIGGLQHLLLSRRISNGPWTRMHPTELFFADDEDNHRSAVVKRVAWEPNAPRQPWLEIASLRHEIAVLQTIHRLADGQPTWRGLDHIVEIFASEEAPDHLALVEEAGRDTIEQRWLLDKPEHPERLPATTRGWGDEHDVIIVEAADERELARFSARDILGMFEKCAEALLQFHAVGGIHLDVKPANFIFVGGEKGNDDDDERVKIIDFGISQSLEGSPLPPFEYGVLGTNEYMAPEQARAWSALRERALQGPIEPGLVRKMLAFRRMPIDRRHEDSDDETSSDNGEPQAKIRLTAEHWISFCKYHPAGDEHIPHVLDFIALCLRTNPRKRATARELFVLAGNAIEGRRKTQRTRKVSRIWPARFANVAGSLNAAKAKKKTLAKRIDKIKRLLEVEQGAQHTASCTIQ